jgi:hypothetical protein
MGPGAWEEKPDGLAFLREMRHRRVRGLGSPADGLGHCVPPSGWRKPTPPLPFRNLPFLPIRIGVPHGTEGGPSHAGAGYLHYGRTAVKGPGRGRKSCPEDGLPHPGPTHRGGSALSPSVPESLFPLGVPIVPGVEASCRVRPQMQTLRPGFSKHESEILWGPLPSIGRWPTHYSLLATRNSASRPTPEVGSRAPSLPYGPMALRPFWRGSGHSDVSTGDAAIRQSSPVTCYFNLIFISCILHLVSCIPFRR